MKKDWYVGIDVSKKWLDVAIFVENSELKGYSHTQVRVAQGARCGRFYVYVRYGAHGFLLGWSAALPRQEGLQVHYARACCHQALSHPAP